MRKPTFEEIWSRHARRHGNSPELEPLARRLYQALLADTLDLLEIRYALESLLTFLASPAGRTEANCAAIDHFLCLGEFEWSDLPDTIQDVLGDMAGALHDTVSSPQIAANFESTPEQLLARLRAAS